MRKDYSNTTGWQKGFHSKREYSLVGAAKQNPSEGLTDKERSTLLDALEIACEHTTSRKRSAIKKVYDKLAA